MNDLHQAKLRVCIAGRAPFWGGAEVAALRLAEGLREQGHHALMLLGQDGPVAQRYAEAGLATQILPMGYTSWYGALRYFTRRRAIRQLLRREVIDVLHVNDLPTAQICVDAARGLNLRTVVHHRFIYGCRAINWFNRSEPDLHVFVSDALRQQLHAASPQLAAQRSAVVHDGLAITPVIDRAAARDELHIHRNRIVVLFAGQLIERKGVADLIEGWALLPEALRQRSELIIVGDALHGETAYRQRLATMAEQINPRPRLVGFQKNVDSWLAASDLAVVPSHAEPLGNATLEAMRAGRAVIGSDVGGIPEMVADGETGLLVPPRDKVALARAMTRLMTDTVERSTMGEAGRRRCEAHFSLARHTQNILACYALPRSRERSAAA